NAAVGAPGPLRGPARLQLRPVRTDDSLLLDLSVPAVADVPPGPRTRLQVVRARVLGRDGPVGPEAVRRRRSARPAVRRGDGGERLQRLPGLATPHGRVRGDPGPTTTLGPAPRPGSEAVRERDRRGLLPRAARLEERPRHPRRQRRVHPPLRGLERADRPLSRRPGRPPLVVPERRHGPVSPQLRSLAGVGPRGLLSPGARVGSRHRADGARLSPPRGETDFGGRASPNALVRYRGNFGSDGRSQWVLDSGNL